MLNTCSHSSEATDAPKPYLGIYGTGSEKSPEIQWFYSKNSKPAFADVELKYGTNSDGSLKTAYIKFKVMSEALEGDCCGTEGGDKWALWLAMGTGQVHRMYQSKSFSQSINFHLIGVDTSVNYWYYDIIKGDACKGWIKAIFYLDPTDVKIWLTAVVGTFWYENQRGTGFDTFGHDSTYPNGGNAEQIDPANAPDTYFQNLLEAAELNIFAEVELKEAITLKFAALNIPLNTKYTGNATPSWNMNPVYAGSIEIDLESDSGHTISLGAVARYDSSKAATETEWAMDAYLGSFDLNMNGGFPVEALSTVKFGAFAKGDLNNNNAFGLNIEEVNLVACFSADLTCCVPEFKIGLSVGKSGSESNSEYALKEVFGSYSHAIGTYGPVSLEGTFGFVYAFEAGTVDQGDDYGQGKFTGPAFGLAYEVTGTMIW